MKYNRLIYSALAALLISLPAQSHAVVIGSLNFITPDATVGPHDEIQIWLRLTLNPDSTPFVFSGNPLSGFAADDPPLNGQYYDLNNQTWVFSTFASYTRAYLNTFYAYSGNSFVSPTNSKPNYRFEFWTSSEPGLPSMVFVDNFTLAPGTSYDYLLGTFIPVASGAAAGTYTFYETGLIAEFIGFDTNGHLLMGGIDFAYGYGIQFNTCLTHDASCAFTRTVAAEAISVEAISVTEPSSYITLAAGLVALSIWRRRHA